jgi:hypothetical protein
MSFNEHTDEEKRDELTRLYSTFTLEDILIGVAVTVRSLEKAREAKMTSHVWDLEMQLSVLEEVLEQRLSKY